MVSFIPIKQNVRLSLLNQIYSNMSQQNRKFRHTQPKLVLSIVQSIVSQVNAGMRRQVLHTKNKILHQLDTSNYDLGHGKHKVLGYENVKSNVMRLHHIFPNFLKSKTVFYYYYYNQSGIVFTNNKLFRIKKLHGNHQFFVRIEFIILAGISRIYWTKYFKH